MSEETDIQKIIKENIDIKEWLKSTYPDYRGQIEHSKNIPEKQARYIDPSKVLDQKIADEFEKHIGDLYRHQAKALENLSENKNICVSTSTSSGKTYIYGLHIARKYLEDNDFKALIVHPTKALSRDQERELNDFFNELGIDDITVGVYDGDTNSNIRRDIRENADIIITNFAGVNTYLYNHPKWRKFLSKCRLLVIDESHTYTGIHGMHVAWTIKRLRRIIQDYGSKVQIICTSATIGNPGEHSRKLTGKKFSVIEKDGSPRGKREIIFWDIPIRENQIENPETPREIQKASANPIRQASSLITHLGNKGLKILAFCRSRKETELGSKYVKQEATNRQTNNYIDINPYHAGLTKKQRRSIENKFKSQVLDSVFSTNALELGIDIGSIDTTILTGYPGTRQSFWQQIGRSGRGKSDALSIFISRNDAIDQYILDNPEYILEDNIEEAVIELENNPVYAEHLLCAADEKPLTEKDKKWFGKQRLERAVKMWKDVGRLEGDLDRGVGYIEPPRPQSEISMYTSSDIQFKVRCQNNNIDIENLDRERVYRDHHTGALFLHNGRQFEVLEVREDIPNPYITVREVNSNHYTQAISTKQVSDLKIRKTRDTGDEYKVCFGEGTVKIHYYEYVKREIYTDRLIDKGPTGQPPIELNTNLVWIETPESLEEDILKMFIDKPIEDVSEGKKTNVPGGALHGSEHGMIKISPIELMMDKEDIGGLSIRFHPETECPTWFIHDTVQGGVGFSKKIYEKIDTVLEKTLNRVSSCTCTWKAGCPRCIMDSQCGNNNEYLNKKSTIEILSRIYDKTVKNDI